MSLTPTITFSGLASGLDSNSIVSQLMAIQRQPITKLNQQKSDLNVQQSQYNQFKTRITELKSAIQKINDAKLSSSSDLFKKKSSAVADATVADATTTNSAVKGTYNLTVIALATSTRAQSTGNVGRITTATTNVKDINNGSLTAGEFSLFVNGNRQTITVDPNADTIADVLGRVQTLIPGSSASVDPSGKLVLDYGAGNSVSFGATGDTSNFASVMGLNNGTTNTVGPTTTFTASKGTSETKLSGTLVGNAANLGTAATAGTFTVGTKQYTIDGTTTLQGLMDQINAGGEVTATYDSINNKMVLNSQKTGQQAITMGAPSDTSNFLSAVGLVTGGNSLASQTLGSNAQFSINGSNYTSTSNSGIDASVHGQTGLTLNLKKAAATTITVGDSTDDLKTAVKDVVTKMNDMLTFVKGQTTGDLAKLKGENGVVRLRDSLRNTFSEAVSGLTEYSNLSTVGISTGAVSANTSNVENTQFKFDEAKFMAALQDNPDEVKKLLIGDASSDGIFGKALKIADDSLNPTYGLFSSREKSTNDRIKTINDSIKKMEERLTRKEKQLRAQFTAMETTISRLRQQQAGLPA